VFEGIYLVTPMDKSPMSFRLYFSFSVEKMFFLRRGVIVTDS